MKKILLLVFLSLISFNILTTWLGPCCICDQTPNKNPYCTCNAKNKTDCEKGGTCFYFTGPPHNKTEQTYAGKWKHFCSLCDPCKSCYSTSYYYLFKQGDHNCPPPNSGQWKFVEKKSIKQKGVSITQTCCTYNSSIEPVESRDKTAGWNWSTSSCPF